MSDYTNAPEGIEDDPMRGRVSESNTSLLSYPHKLIPREHYHVDMNTRTASPDAPKGWKCPNCGKAHSPEIQSCPNRKVDDRTYGDRVREANSGN